MKKILLTIVAMLLTSSVFASKYKLDESHTYIGFKVKYLAFSTVRGKFDKFSGSSNFDEKSGKLSALQATITATSINTNEPDRDKHLRSADFFDVKKHKNVTFTSTKVIYKNKKPSKIVGKLTIHGVTKTINLKVTDWGGTAVDPWGNKRIAFEATAKIDRRNYGLKWNKGLKQVGGLMVSNEIEFVLQLQAIKID